MALGVKYKGKLKDPSKEVDLVGIYRAVVEDNMDPYQIGRVKIRVPMLHGLPGEGISTKALPWAYVCFTSAGYEYGSFIVPEVGEYGFVMFEDGDSSKPIYLGSSYGRGPTQPKKYGSEDGIGTWTSEPFENEVPNDVEGEIPSGKLLYKSPKGSAIYIDDSNGGEDISIVDPLGQVIRMESNLTNGMKHSRHFGDVDSFDEDANLDESTGSRIVIMDSKRQRLEMQSNKLESMIFLGTESGDGITIRTRTEQPEELDDENEEMEEDNIDHTFSIQIEGTEINIGPGGGISIKGNKKVEVEADEFRFKGDFTIIGS